MFVGRKPSYTFKEMHNKKEKPNKERVRADHKLNPIGSGTKNANRIPQNTNERELHGAVRSRQL